MSPQNLEKSVVLVQKSIDMVQKSVITLQNSAIITDAKCVITQAFQNKPSLVTCDCNFRISNVYFFIHFEMNIIIYLNIFI